MYKYCKKILCIVLATAVTTCTFTSNMMAAPIIGKNVDFQIGNANEVGSNLETDQKKDYVEVRLKSDEDTVNGNGTSYNPGNLHLADDSSFFTGAMEAMHDKVDRNKNNTLKLRAAEKRRLEASNEADGWTQVHITENITKGLALEDKHKYIIDSSISITNEEAPTKDAISISKNALVHIEIVDGQKLTIKNVQINKAAISLPVSSQLVIYGSTGDNSNFDVIVDGKIFDRDWNPDSDSEKDAVDSGTLYVLGKAKFEGDTEHTGLVYANYLSQVTGGIHTTYGRLRLNEDGTVWHFDCEIVDDLATFEPEDKHFYYITKDISYTANDIQSGIKIPEKSTVFIGVAPDITLNVTGGNAKSGYSNGAGAGIEVPENSKLVLMGDGTINATGGSSNSDMGFGAGIGGRGGNSGKNGQNCGEIYIIEKVTVNATHGEGPVSSVFPAFGIGGGGAGGVDYMDGTNGEVYYDHEAKKSNGRTRFYHEANITVNLNYDIEVKGNKDLVLGDEYRGEITAENVFNALGELYRRGGVSKGADTWETVIYDENYEQNEHCNGAYRTSGGVWNKHFVDHTGGYLYLFAVTYGSYLTKNFTNNDDYPMAHINYMLNNSLSSIKDDSKYAECRNILSEILFQEHYQEPFGLWKSTAYTRDNPTVGDYDDDDIDDALQYVGMTYISVLDDTSARYCSMQYDTHRFPHDEEWWGNYHYGYGTGGDTFKCLDGYKGVNGYNWMNFLPDNASLAQLNMPGTHDSGTFNIKADDELMDRINDHLWDMWDGNVPWWGNAIIIGAHCFILTLPLALLADIIFSFVILDRFNLINDGIQWIAQCQDLPIIDQLKSGGRILDVRVSYAHEKDGTETDPKKLLKIVHGTLDDLPDIDGLDKPTDHDVIVGDCHDMDGNLLTFDDILNDCQKFLADEKSRNESVVLILQTESHIEVKDSNSSLVKTLNSVYDFINEGGDNIYEIKAGETIPSVGEAKGNIYIINGDDENGIKTYDKVPEPSDWDVPAQNKIEYLKEVFEEAESIAQVYGESKTLSAKDYQPKRAYASTYDVSWEWQGLFQGKTLEGTVEGTPRKFAEIVNAFVEGYEFTRGQYYGWIQFNFPTDITNAKIYYANTYDKGKLTSTSAEKVRESLKVYGLENKEYTGKPITQDIKIYHKGVQLKKGVDYDLEYSNNIDAGVANITIKCKGLYIGEAMVSFTIEPKDVNKLSIKDVDNVKVPDAGKAVKVLSYVKDGKKVLSGDGKDYSVKYLNNEGKEISLTDIVAGSYKMIITCDGNYCNTYENDFYVIPKNAVAMSTAKVTLDKKSVVYGSNLPRVKKVKVGGKTYTDSSVPSIADMFEIKYPKDEGKIGTHKIAVNVKNGVAFEAGAKVVAGKTRVAYKVNKIKLTKEMFSIEETYSYEGKSITPSISSELIRLKDYDVVSIKGGNTGRNTVTLKGIGNYTGTVKLNYNIRKCDLSKTSISINSIAPYDKKGAKTDITISISGNTLKQGVDYRVTYENNRALGTATAVIKGKGDYTGSYTGEFTVIKAQLDPSMIVVKDMVYKKTKSQYKPSVTVKQGSAKLKKETDYTLSYEGDGTVAEKDMADGYKEITVTIKATELGMYIGEASKKFTVYSGDRVAGALDGTVADRYYTGEPVNISPKHIKLKDKNGNLLSVASDDISIISYKNNLKVGNRAAVTFKVKGYGGLKTLKFKILPKLIK